MDGSSAETMDDYWVVSRAVLKAWKTAESMVAWRALCSVGKKAGAMAG